jgi:hypothetical protein
LAFSRNPRTKHKSRRPRDSTDTMPDKKARYTIYGEVPETSKRPWTSTEGSWQPVELEEMGEIKMQVERVLQGLAIRYPIKSKAEFLKAVAPDVPGICDIGKRKLSLRDLIKLLREADFPLHSDHEAAELLAASCPIPARSME